MPFIFFFILRCFDDAAFYADFLSPFSMPACRVDTRHITLPLCAFAAFAIDCCCYYFDADIDTLMLMLITPLFFRFFDADGANIDERCHDDAMLMMRVIRRYCCLFKRGRAALCCSMPLKMLRPLF